MQDDELGKTASTSEPLPTALQTAPEQAATTGKPVLIREPETGRFPKGVSGNPKGRPTNAERRQSYLEALRHQVESDPEPLASAVRRKALKGDIRAHTFIRDTLYGTPEKTVRVIDQAGPLAGLLAGLPQIVEGEVRLLDVVDDPPITDE